MYHHDEQNKQDVILNSNPWSSPFSSIPIKVNVTSFTCFLAGELHQTRIYHDNKYILIHPHDSSPLSSSSDPLFLLMHLSCLWSLLIQKRLVRRWSQLPDSGENAFFLFSWWQRLVREMTLFLLNPYVDLFSHSPSFFPSSSKFLPLFLHVSLSRRLYTWWLLTEQKKVEVIVTKEKTVC